MEWMEEFVQAFCCWHRAERDAWLSKHLKILCQNRPPVKMTEWNFCQTWITSENTPLFCLGRQTRFSKPDVSNFVGASNSDFHVRRFGGSWKQLHFHHLSNCTKPKNCDENLKKKNPLKTWQKDFFIISGGSFSDRLIPRNVSKVSWKH